MRATNHRLKACAILLTITLGASAQTWKPPLTADGQPDLQGIRQWMGDARSLGRQHAGGRDH